MRRKLALLGNEKGPWVRTGDFTVPTVSVQIPDGTVVEIHLSDSHQPEGSEFTTFRITEAGNHRLVPSLWMRALIREGTKEGVVCVFKEVA